MRRAAFIVNLEAGRGSLFENLRDHLLWCAEVHGLSASVQMTTPDVDSARQLAAQASRTCDLVFACGGDGTVHGVVQGLAGTSATLGVLPFGTANALARNLRLPMNPVHALEQLLSLTPKRIPLGRAQTSVGERWFTVMAGAGPDGSLVHEMRLAAKSLAGRRAYYTEAARLFLSRRFAVFQVDYRLVGSFEWRSRTAIGMMASRVPDLGGLFTGLTAASRLHHPHLLIHVLAAPAHLALPAWLALGRMRLARANPWLTVLEVEEARCTPLHQNRHVYAQVDGEAVGPLPMAIDIVPSALTLLMP